MQFKKFEKTKPSKIDTIIMNVFKIHVFYTNEQFNILYFIKNFISVLSAIVSNTCT